MKPRHILIAIAFTAAQLAWAQPAFACHKVVFEATSVEIGEGGGFVQLTLEYGEDLPACQGGDVTYTTQDGTALANEDYVPVVPPQVVTFAQGETSKQIQIGIKDDHNYEPQPEMFQVLLSAAGGDVSEVGEPATVTITENDVAPPPGGGSPSPTPKPSPKVIVKSPKPASVVTLSPPAPPSPSPSPSSTRLARLFSPDPTPDPRAAGEGGGFPFGLVAAIAGGVLALVAGGIWILARRAA